MIERFIQGGPWMVPVLLSGLVGLVLAGIALRRRKRAASLGPWILGAVAVALGFGLFGSGLGLMVALSDLSEIRGSSEVPWETTLMWVLSLAGLPVHLGVMVAGPLLLLRALALTLAANPQYSGLRLFRRRGWVVCGALALLVVVAAAVVPRVVRYDSPLFAIMDLLSPVTVVVTVFTVLGIGGSIIQWKHPIELELRPLLWALVLCVPLAVVAGALTQGSAALKAAGSFAPDMRAAHLTMNIALFGLGRDLASGLLLIPLGAAVAFAARARTRTF